MALSALQQFHGHLICLGIQAWSSGVLGVLLGTMSACLDCHRFLNTENMISYLLDTT